MTRRASSSEVEKVFPHTIYTPYDPSAILHQVEMWSGANFSNPLEYTGWRDEVMSWKESAYIHGHLNPSPTVILRGPDVLKLLSDTCVNSFATFEIGAAKHAIMCNEAGKIMVHGMVLRLAEEEYVTYWLAPWLPYLLLKEPGRYDVQMEDLTGKVFLFQIGGPRSLEILETATGESLRDIRFIRHRRSAVDGMPVNVLRIGMAGSLAYELHGDVEDARPIYEAVVKAGEAYGIRRLGTRAYMLNHTEDGFPQSYYHFPVAWGEDASFVNFLNEAGAGAFGAPRLRGSMGTDIHARYRNPVELGWGHMVKLDHDFIGRAALESEVEQPSRRMVTLVWNSEDILDVHASQFGSGDRYLAMDEPNHYSAEPGYLGLTLWADRVLRDSEDVGISSGRAYSLYYREMLSLASVDSEHAELGTEVTVLWGEPGTPQKEIRATVSRFPYLDLPRNEHIDVATLPSPLAAAGV